MKALKVYSSLDDPYPCRSMDPEKMRNTMILGEGAASFCLEAETAGVSRASDTPGASDALRAQAYIMGIGYGAEAIEHGASLSRSEEHTSELQSLMRISYAVFCLKKKTIKHKN